MKKILATTLFALLLTGCTADFFKAGKEATEAVDNLKNEAINVSEGVQEKIEQVNQAKNSVEEAVNAVNQAKKDLEAVAN